MIAAPPLVLDFEAAQTVVGAQAASLSAPTKKERVALSSSRGRVLAEAILADRDQPPFDRSTRDGFAVLAHEFSAVVPLTVIGTLRAGSVWNGTLQPGTAIEIMTGAPVPLGADAVAMVEHVVRNGTNISASPGRTLEPSSNIVAQGSEARAGTPLVPAGTAIHAAEIALAAACGYPEVNVFRRPRVAIIATGDELVELEVAPQAQQIRNSNSYALAAMVEAAGAEAVRLPITPDERGALTRSLELARACDLVVLSGGVSMGTYDLVEEMLLAAGAEFFFTGVRMQPGKPVVFGKFHESRQFFFGLPGNPISTQVTFHCFVEPFLRVLAGSTWSGPRWAQATLAKDVAPKTEVTRLLPARMETASGTVHVTVVGWQGSGDLTANARANCYAELPPGSPCRGGSVVRVLLR